ncbi:hypothetical protein [Rhizobium lusitanum]
MGRFQPLHFGHQFIIDQALEPAEVSSFSLAQPPPPRSARNP